MTTAGGAGIDEARQPQLDDRAEAGEPDEDYDLPDTSRAEAFSDAVLAIIITLLVLDLRPPETEPGGLLGALLAQWPTYLAYIASYGYVGIVWTNHKAAFRRIRAIDRGLHWRNLFVLFTTGLLPFPTSVLADALRTGNPADARTAVALYALVGAFLAFAWLLFYHYLDRHPMLVDPRFRGIYFASHQLRPLIGIAGYALGGLLGVVLEPAVALLIFLALPIFYAVTSEQFDAHLDRLVPPIRHSDRTT